MTERSLDERFAAFDRNYQEISERIARAAERSGRGPGDITLLAATKTVPVGDKPCHIQGTYTSGREQGAGASGQI